MQTPITPVSVFPSTANVLMIRSITLGPPPAYFYELSNVTEVEKTREVPNPAYIAESVGLDGTVYPAQGEPTITETYTEQVVVVLKNGNVSMTVEQWDNWAAGPETEDDDYQLDCISANLGLTRA
ncbi:MAG: hypothetical protein ACOVN2_04360 [Usitatibacteraceae bacterium]